MNTARIILGVAMLVSGCGGGGNDASAPEASEPLRKIPASASQSAAGMVEYLGSLPSLNADTQEPASLDAFSPKTSEDAEPLPVGG